jgi:hypothetical protein
VEHTKIVLEVLLPTTSMKRVQDFFGDFETLRNEHKGIKSLAAIYGPLTLVNTEKENRNERNRSPEGRDEAERPDHQRAAADDFGSAEGADDRGGEAERADEAEPADRKPAGRKPRSDAGKPRGPRGGAEAGSGAAEGRGNDGDGKRGAEGRRGAERNGDGPAPQGGERGKRQGEGGEQPSGRGGGRTRGADRGDEQAAAVKPAADDWDAPEGGGPDDGENGEEWNAKTPGHDWPDSLTPENITREDLSAMMSDHFRAAGGKSKGPTFQILADVSGVDVLSAVPEEDFDALARRLLKDTARYRHGIKKPATAAPKK